MRAISAWTLRNKAKLCLIFSFVIPVAIMLLISVVMGIYPFGKMSILMADTRYQFTDYFAYLKQIFFDDDTMFYSFSKTFGGDIAGLYAYYMGNPLLLILLAFSNEMLPVGILFLLILMIGLCGLTFNYFISEIYGYRWATLIFSTAYAFNGYITGYINCIIYFLGILLFPIIMLGVYRIVEKSRISILYIVSLAVSVVSCYYIGYMTCIFALLFFIYLFFTKYTKFSEVKKNIRTVVIFIVCSVVACGMAAVGLLCAVISLRGQKSSGLSLSLSQNFKPADVFSGLYSMAFHGNISDGMPLIYCGAIVLSFVFLFFFNKRIKPTEKIWAAVIIGIMLVSFWIDGLNVMWHGFAHPIGFPYRNSFVLPFFLIYIAYRGFLFMDEGLKNWHYLIILGVFGMYSLYLLITHNEYVMIPQIVISGVLLLGAFMAVYLYGQGREYIIPVMAALLFLECTDSFANVYTAIEGYFPNRLESEDYDISKYQNYVEDTQELVNLVEKNDPSFFRMEKLFRRTNNDSMMFGYNGLSHFSSCEKDVNKRFMGSLGFRDNDNWAFYGEGSTSFADCLMGVKYLLSQYDSTAKPYQQILEYEGKYIYLNRYALPLMFGTTDKIKEIAFDSEHHFDFQNEIASSFTEEEYSIYVPVNNIKVNTYNVIQNGNRFTKDNRDEESYIEYSFVAERTDFIFMYFNAPNLQSTTMIVNGLEKAPYFTAYGWSARDMGVFSPGENVNVKIILNQDEIEIDDYEFYYEDASELMNWYNEAGTYAKCVLNKETSSHLKGTVIAKEKTDTLVFSIPYEEEWTVKIDGKKVETYKVLGDLLAVDISGGKHSVEMNYVPKGIIYGGPISLIFIGIFIGLTIYEKKRRFYEDEDRETVFVV